VLDADPTSPGFNCYVSLADAATMVGEELHFTNWEGATDPTREKALMTATRLLDQYVDWYGVVASANQPLAWPRKQVTRADREQGTYFDSSTIPDVIKYATVRYAEALLAEDLAADQASGLSGLSVAGIELRFNRLDRKDPVPPLVRQAVGPYGTILHGRSSTAQLVRR